jgi:hypothetical protein
MQVNDAVKELIRHAAVPTHYPVDATAWDVDAKTNEVTEYVRTHATTRLKLSCYKVCPATKENVRFGVQSDWEAVQDDFSKVVEKLRGIPRCLVEGTIERCRERSEPLPAFDFMLPFFVGHFVECLTKWNHGVNDTCEPHVRIFAGRLQYEEISPGSVSWLANISAHIRDSEESERTQLLPEVIIIGQHCLPFCGT